MSASLLSIPIDVFGVILEYVGSESIVLYHVCRYTRNIIEKRKCIDKIDINNIIFHRSEYYILWLLRWGYIGNTLDDINTLLLYGIRLHINSYVTLSLRRGANNIVDAIIESIKVHNIYAVDILLEYMYANTIYLSRDNMRKIRNATAEILDIMIKNEDIEGIQCIRRLYNIDMDRLLIRAIGDGKQKLREYCISERKTCRRIQNILLRTHICNKQKVIESVLCGKNHKHKIRRKQIGYC